MEAGLHPTYLTVAMNNSEPVKRLAASIQQELESDAADMSKVMQRLGRMAVGRLAQLMDSGSESIALKAAIDLADRSPETQKTQRVEVASLTLSGGDAKAIAEALVESAEAQKQFDGAELVEIPQAPSDMPQTPTHLLSKGPTNAAG